MSGQNQPESSLSPEACKTFLDMCVSDVERIQLVYEAGRKAGAAQQQALPKEPVICVRRMKTPPSSGPISGERIAARMLTICGCKGQYDCDCASIQNEARSQLWYEHNTGREQVPPPERL
jgi:hypothetical protein